MLSVSIITLESNALAFGLEAGWVKMRPKAFPDGTAAGCLANVDRQASRVFVVWPAKDIDAGRTRTGGILLLSPRHTPNAVRIGFRIIRRDFFEVAFLGQKGVEGLDMSVELADDIRIAVGCIFYGFRWLRFGIHGRENVED